MKIKYHLIIYFTFAFAFLSANTQAALVVPTGLSPGDTYHVMFVTSDTRDATSSNIADYDAFVQDVADAAGIGSSIGVDWRAVGSTSTVNAIDHLAPLFLDLSTPIYNQNGDLIATDYFDLWDGTLLSPIFFDEYGMINALPTWTGSTPTGIVEFSLGSGGFATYGSPGATGRSWVDSDIAYYGGARPFYGVSSAITIVPVPAAFWLFSIGLLGLVGVARRQVSQKQVIT